MTVVSEQTELCQKSLKQNLQAVGEVDVTVRGRGEAVGAAPLAEDHLGALPFMTRFPSKSLKATC